jgi:hypothetical protein
MILLQRQGSIIVMISGLTKRLMAVTTADIALAILRHLRRELGVMIGML